MSRGLAGRKGMSGGGVRYRGTDSRTRKQHFCFLVRVTVFCVKMRPSHAFVKIIVDMEERLIFAFEAVKTLYF